jgi:hypothetical protein
MSWLAATRFGLWTAIRFNPLPSPSYLSLASREFEICVIYPLHLLTWKYREYRRML